MIETLFHPIVCDWFRRNFESPSPCQREAWPSIGKGRHTLIAAPTGSGKTLAAFLAGIDQLVRAGLSEGLPDQTRILYISPLKALSNDIQRNLEAPLADIDRMLVEKGHPEVLIRAMVRSGDTPASARLAMAKKPPHILVTTPESFYILLTSESGRRVLKTVCTVIVDEIHALVAGKRGAHLALSLERLEVLTGRAPTRIGLSATQRPIESIARFLLGSERPLNECSIIDTGHRRELDLAIELPACALEALLSGQAASQIYDRLADLIKAHKTTLIFVNTRRMAERVARHLSERLDPDSISSHHGSLAREQRFEVEQKLKTGQLRALVATASLELGIDIGDVDLVCQIGTTRSISVLLQRVGRSGHSAHGKPKGRLFPTSRDELIECIALIDAIRRGELDRIWIPEGPLDVLAQQLVAMVSAGEWDEDELFQTVRKAAPYRDLERLDFDRTLRMLSEGFSTRLGRRSAYLHHDSIHRKLRPRPNARLTAITCGGAIPDNADYRVILDPGGRFIGTVDEDFAIESLTGDIFQLGNNSWRILRMEAGDLHVEDAENLPPSIPFWMGEAPGRTRELSFAVSRLREEIAERHEPGPEGSEQALNWLRKRAGIDPESARQAVNYIGLAKVALGAMPSFDTLVLERFFDESGGMQLILHSPFGNRINRAWGLALRKRFCRTFNFELQAAATENAIILSLGTAHSFELEAVARYLHSSTVRDLLIQALLDAPMFKIRWRWNCTSALAVRRFQGGRKTPPYLVRMQSEDLITSVFPQQMACLENISGDREIPEHPLVQQSIHDCLNEAMDVDGLIEILKRIENGQMNVIARDVVEPSPLAAEILNARNYAFLDGAPAEERRTRAVMSRRWLDPETAADLGQLDAAAIEKVHEELWPRANTADELHDALMLLAFLVEGIETPAHWRPFFDELVAQQRAMRFASPNQTPVFWVAAERLALFAALYGVETPNLSQSARDEPGTTRYAFTCPFEKGGLRGLYLKKSPLTPLLQSGGLNSYAADSIVESQPCEATAAALPELGRETALTEILRARLQNTGPVQSEWLSRVLGIEFRAIESCLMRLESEGVLLRGRFTPGCTDLEWCERGILARIHRHTLKHLRKQIEPRDAHDFMRFLFRWQHLDADHRMQGNDAFHAIIGQLEGFEAAASVWESQLLPARIEHYNPDGLDNLCMSGRFLWSRFGAPSTGASPIRSTPLSFLARQNLALWKATRATEIQFPIGIAHTVLDLLIARGALFYDELLAQSRLLPSQLETALAELVAKGWVTSDRFSGMRALLIPEHKRRGRLAPIFGLQDAGRWALVDPLSAQPDSKPHSPDAPSKRELNEAMIEELALILLRRYGIVFRALLTRESLFPEWNVLVPMLRRMEASGKLRGGIFVANQLGEQFALPEAVESLRKIPKASEACESIVINASDPLNLLGIVIEGPRVTAHATNRILFQAGIPQAYACGLDTRFLRPVADAQRWEVKQKLIRNLLPSSLRSQVDS